MFISANSSYQPRPNTPLGIDNCLGLSPAERARAFQALDLAGEALRKHQEAHFSLCVRAIDLAASDIEIAAAKAKTDHSTSTVIADAPASPQKKAATGRTPPANGDDDSDSMQRALERALHRVAAEGAAGSEVSILNDDADLPSLAPGKGPSLDETVAKFYAYFQHYSGNNETVDVNAETAEYWVRLMREDRKTYNFFLYNCLNALNRLDPEAMRASLDASTAKHGKGLGTIEFLVKLKSDIVNDLTDSGYPLLKDIIAARNGVTFHAKHGLLCLYSTRALVYARDHGDKPLQTEAHRLFGGHMDAADDLETDQWTERHEPNEYVQGAFAKVGGAVSSTLEAAAAANTKGYSSVSNPDGDELIKAEQMADKHYETVAAQVKVVAENAFDYGKRQLAQLVSTMFAGTPTIVGSQVMIDSSPILASTDDDSRSWGSSSRSDEDESGADPFEEADMPGEKPATAVVTEAPEAEQKREASFGKMDSFLENYAQRSFDGTL